MSYHTSSFHPSLSQTTNTGRYHGDQDPSQPSSQAQPLPTQVWRCCRCYAALSIFNGSPSGTQVCCTRNPCRCAPPGSISSCLCDVGYNLSAQVSRMSEDLQPSPSYAAQPYQHNSHPDAVPYPHHYAPSVSIQAHHPFVMNPSLAQATVSGHGASTQADHDYQHVGAQFTGIVPPTIPSPDLLIGNSSGVGRAEQPRSAARDDRRHHRSHRSHRHQRNSDRRSNRRHGSF